MVSPRKAQIFLFITIVLENFAGFRPETAVSVKLVSYQSYKPCDSTCDFSFSIFLKKRCMDHHCFIKSLVIGPFPNENPVTFAAHAIYPLLFYVPDSEREIYLSVKVTEKGTYSDGHHLPYEANWSWAHLTKRLVIIPVRSQSHALEITSNQTRLTFELSTFCTPPIYVRNGMCTKYCNDFSEHYTCTVNGDEICKPGRKCQLSTTPLPVNQNQAMTTSVPESGKDIALPVGLAIGLLILVTLVVALIVHLIRRRKRKNKNTTPTMDTFDVNSRAEMNDGSSTTDAAYDTLHGSDSQTATHYEHLRHPYESLHLQQTPSETHGAVPENKESEYVNVNNTYEEIIE